MTVYNFYIIQQYPSVYMQSFIMFAACKHICVYVCHASSEGRGLCHNCVTCPCFSQISSATEIYPLLIAKFGVNVVVAVVI